MGSGPRWGALPGPGGCSGRLLSCRLLCRRPRLRRHMVVMPPGGLAKADGVGCWGTRPRRPGRSGHRSSSLASMDERQEQWESRYAAVDRLWSEQPNDWLPELAAAWEPGRALDLGCGEGADAVWLAGRGWEVTGVDLSATAIARMEAEARRRGLEAGTKTPALMQH